ncbi:MAG: class I SAM-dependent rRNA methyltransferase [Planctomycetota bacterium]|jgi:23S rRNA (cytosine1962-C5)-methyltransferase|nr:class I SAM-dependent rRNA methyltransferase [Planctomycetota bacterium]
MSKAVVVRRRKVPGVLNGSPWIYPNALLDVPDTAGTYPVRTDGGDHLGVCDFNPAAPIPGRILTRAKSLDNEEEWLTEAIHHAINRRLRLGYQIQGGAFRMVNGEGDGLPGLVIDMFGRTMVADCYSRGMRDRMPLIEKVLSETLGDCPLLLRMGADAAKREGIDPIDPPVATISFAENAVVFDVALGSDQKSGFYLDQRDNRRLAARWASGRQVLDLFCYHGAFALGCLAGGAKSALAVDSSEKALSAAQANATRNGLALDVLPADVFDALGELHEVGPFDLIICDPPKLAPGKRDKNKGLKAYRYLIDKCLGLLPPGGILLVSSCSQAIGEDDMRKLIMQQAAKKQMYADVIAVSGHPADHPWPIGFETGRYLSTVAVMSRGPW